VKREPVDSSLTIVASLLSEKDFRIELFLLSDHGRFQHNQDNCPSEGTIWNKIPNSLTIPSKGIASSRSKRGKHKFMGC